MSTNCLIPNEFVEDLEKKYKVKLKGLRDLNEISAVNNYLSEISNLTGKNIVKNLENIKGEVNALLEKIKTEEQKQEKKSPQKRDKYYVYLKTGTDKKDTERGYTQHDLDGFAQMFNSSFISLYNKASLYKLFNIERKIAGSDARFKNKGLLDVIDKYLTQIDETEEVTEGNRKITNEDKIDALKLLFKTGDEAYGDYQKNDDTKLFYAEQVYPIMMDFLYFYYKNYFVTDIFRPELNRLQETTLGMGVEELINVNPAFNELSKSKDILAGSIIAFSQLNKELSEEGLSSQEKLDIINKSNFNKVADRLMESFRYNDKSFGDLKEVDDTEEQSNIDTSNDEKITKEAFSSSGNETSAFQSASRNTRAVLSSLFDMDKNVITDLYGLPVLLNPITTFKKLSKILRGTIDYSAFYKILKDEKANLPFIEQLLDSYLVIDPNKSIEEFFSRYKYPQTRAYYQKIKQGFLKDLSKNRVEAKEINLKVTRKYNKETNTSFEIISAEVNDAKQKKTIAIEKEAITRFHQKYFKDKKLVFGEQLIDGNNNIRLTSIVKAALMFEKISKQKNPDININDVLDVLAVFGIVPSDSLKNNYNSLKNLLKKDGQINGEKSNGHAVLSVFFRQLPLGDYDYLTFPKIFEKVKQKNINQLTYEIQKTIISTIVKFQDKRANKENIAALKAALLDKTTYAYKLNSLLFDDQINGETNNSLSQVNNTIENLTDFYLSNVANLYSENAGDITLKNNLLRNLTKDFSVLLSNELEELTVKAFGESLDISTTPQNKLIIEETYLNLTNPMSQLKNSLTGLYSAYTKLEEKFVIEDDGIIDFNNKPRHLVQSLNNIMIKSRDLNTKNPKLLVRFPELDPKLNNLVLSSWALKQMYKIDADGRMTPNTQSQFKFNINNILGVKLTSSSVNSGGVSINNQYKDDNILSSLILLLNNGFDESMNSDKEAAPNIQFSNINHQTLLDKDNATTSKLTSFLPIPSTYISKLFSSYIQEFKDESGNTKSTLKYLNYASGQKRLDGMKPIADIFANYLTQYLLLYYRIEKGDMQYVKDDYEYLGKNYKELGLFEKDSRKDPSKFIINADLKDKLKQAVLETDLTGMSLGEQTESIKSIITDIKFKTRAKGSGYYQFTQDLFNHFSTQVDDITDSLSYAKNPEELKNLVELFKNKGKEKAALPYVNDFSNIAPEIPIAIDNIKDINISNKSILKGLLMTYVINYQILTQEKQLLFFGDSMFLKESSYVKRASSSGSTGSYVLMDDWDIKYYNYEKNEDAFAYAKALNQKLQKEGKGIDMSLHSLGNRFRFTQVEDNNLESVVHGRLFSEFKESFKIRFGDRFTTAEIEDKAKRALKNYLNLNEADGFGVITLDWYKILSDLSDTWSSEQEAVYKRIIAGEEIPESLSLVTFPVRKFQYAGVFFKQEGQLPADGLHKFSLAPLIPGSNNNLSTKHDNMVKEGIVYEIFNSSSKKEKINNENGKKDYFYDGVQSQRIIAPLEAKKVNGKYVYQSGKQILYGITSLIKDQVHIDTEIKTKIILARQLKRIGKTDLFEFGVPLDYESTNKEDRREEWESLSETAKRSSSNIYKTYRDIVNNIGKINSLERETILKRLGLEEYKTSEDSKTVKLRLIPGEGQKTLINTLKRELLKRIGQQKTGGANAYVRLMSIEEKSDTPELEAFVNLRSLKSIMKGIIDNETKFRKFNGSNLIQSPVIGMEDKATVFNKENILVDQTGYLKTYRFGKTINKKEISKLEKERDKELEVAKSIKLKKEINNKYDAKIKVLSATTLAEVMITFSPEWEHLLSLYYNDKEIGDLDTLNNILRNDKKWVEENRDKLIMLAVRVPIQDPNSIEAFIVKEFLPMTSGSKIIVPSEIVAKSGGDFDIDKLMVYYYNVIKDFDEGEFGSIPMDESKKGLENKIIKGYMDLLLLPEMFYKLITANSVSVLKKDKDDTVDQIVDELEKTNKGITKYDSTDLRMALFNVVQKTILQIAKKLLGHAATIRSNFEELKHAGVNLSPEYNSTLVRYLSKKEKLLITDEELAKTLTGNEKVKVKIRFPFKMADGSLGYNTSKTGNMDLSGIFNKDNDSITEIISAIMNGLVDVNSDPWIVIFNMNEELTSYNFLMLISGVSKKITFKVNNQKIVKDYIENKLALKKSLFKRMLNRNRTQNEKRLLEDTMTNVIEDFVEEVDGQRTLSDDSISTLKDMFTSVGILDGYVNDYLDTYIETEGNKEARKVNQIVFNVNLEKIMFQIQDQLSEDDFLTDEDLTKMLGKTYKDMGSEELSKQLILLATTVFMKPAAEGLTRGLAAIDYDKSQSEYIHDEYNNQNNLRLLKSRGFFDKKSFANLQRLNVSAPYNFSELTKTAASIVAPLTESKKINKYALALTKVLRKNYFLNDDKKDSFTNAFKSEFINYIVQNYGTIPSKTKDKEQNIVEYAIKNGIFVDKKVMGESGLLYTSDKLEDKSLASKLFGLVSIFDNKFNGLDIFKDYIIPMKGQKIKNEDEEESELDFVYKIGRVFKDLTPLELDDYNHQLKIFKYSSLNIQDVLRTIEKNGYEVMNQFINEEDMPFSDMYDKLMAYKEEKDLDSLGSIEYNNESQQKIGKKTIDALTNMVNKANRIKAETANMLPHLSLLQETSSYSNTSISNLFISENHAIIKKAITRFKESSGDWEGALMDDLLKNFTIPFLINNINLLPSDKKFTLLKMIAGFDQSSKEKVNLKGNKIINTSNYFTNYYSKEFSITEPNTNFETATPVLEVFANSGLASSFLFKFLEVDSANIENELEDDEMDLEDTYDDNYVDAEDIPYTTVMIDNAMYLVDPTTDEVTDQNDKVVTGKDKNRILANYYSTANKLKSASLGDKLFYVIGTKIINQDFTDAKLNGDQRKNLIIMDFNITIC